jgi:hypothetical protein
MGVPGRKAAARTSASRDPDAEIYDRYAVGLYRQALLALGDEGMRSRLSQEGAAGTVRGLALSALRRCQELAAGHNRRAPGQLTEDLPGRPLALTCFLS